MCHEHHHHHEEPKELSAEAKAWLFQNGCEKPCEESLAIGNHPDANDLVGALNFVLSMDAAERKTVWREAAKTIAGQKRYFAWCVKCQQTYFELKSRETELTTVESECLAHLRVSDTDAFQRQLDQYTKLEQIIDQLSKMTID